MSLRTITSLAVTRRGGSWRDERGSASAQVVIYTPLLFFTIVLIVFGGRLALAKQSFTQVAAATARTASLARTDATAHTQGLAAAKAALATVNLHCDDEPTITLDGTVTATTPGQVMTATVSCQLSVHDSWVPIAAVRHLTATASSPIDIWRGQ